MSLFTKEQVIDFDKKFQSKFGPIIWSLMDLFRSNGLYDINLHPVLHFISKALEFDNPFGIKLADLEEICSTDADEAAWMEINSMPINEEVWKKTLKTVIDSLSKKEFTEEELALFSISFAGLNAFSECSATPKSIIKLATSILNIQPNENVADIGCGSGSFIIEAWKKQDKAIYFGCEKVYPYVNCCRIRTGVLDGNFSYFADDAFKLVEDTSKKFDKIFSNYPFKIRISNLGCGEDYLNQLRKRIPSISKATTSDWIYNSLLCDLLTEKGKAVAVMTNGSTWNKTDKAVRQYFIENGFVEAVISLPGKLFAPETMIPTSMIILSKGNNSVKIVDATNIFEAGRRGNELSDDNIESIISALKEDCEYSITLSKDSLRDNDYNLNFDRYVAQEMNLDSLAPFSTVITNITRGAGIKAEELDKITTNEVTNMNYLMLGNIHDGIIDEELPYLSVIEKNLEKYCLKRNNLILSKNGYPFKIAIASPKEGQQILANGNLFIIEIDEKKANPYFIKAFFESEQGIAALKSIVVGSTIPNIGVESLKTLKIPLPSLEEQNKIAEKYQATQDEIKVLKLRLAKAVDRLYHIFDEGEND
jgi:type I restriction enzyme M protein